jgi:hypothetical protein
MTVETAASAIGKQVVTHAVGTWLGARRERAQRGAELIDLFGSASGITSRSAGCSGS